MVFKKSNSAKVEDFSNHLKNFTGRVKGFNLCLIIQKKLENFYLFLYLSIHITTGNETIYNAA